ncbi:MAG: DUF512 domain-containing protein [Bacteroidetes Order II. Incertae sedis bacterium]|nr:DUF512 domain-containing protein [Bacteroidetes Order II. bacterium]
MPVTIKAVEPDSVADLAGWKAGDQVVSINFHPIQDVLDFRFYAAEERLDVKIRKSGLLTEQTIENRDLAPMGVELEDFRIKHCGDDCMFCFVDQNPQGLRESLYFRDGDYRMSFLYGNYITMTNLRERDLDRIVTQRLSPLYISVHCTDNEIRHKMMGHKTDDRLMEKLQLLRDHDIEMHTQIVLVPDWNDGEVLWRTVHDLYALNDAIQSVAVVPVGLTAHRVGLHQLRPLSQQDARTVISKVHGWQDTFYAEIGRRFVYLSDEIYLLADASFPEMDRYDDFPLMENGVGMCRDFVTEFDFQAEEFPDTLETPRTVTLVTGELPAPILKKHIAPRLNRVSGLSANVVVAPNVLFGRPVTVSGLLSYQCFVAALKGRDLGDLVLLPPDCLNFEGLFMDNKTPEDLSAALGGVPVQVFGGDWVDFFEILQSR